MSDQVWWYATRAAGLMTWSTAVASVIVGLLLSTRAVKSRTGPWMLDLHRFLGGISVLFLVVHVGTLYLDSFVEFGPRELFIPGESTWNTEAAAWGIIAMYALVLVELTSLLRKHLSQSVWRTFHMLSVVTAAAGTYHAILGGSDVDNPLTWVVAGAGSAIVIALVALRLKGSDQPTSPRTAKANDREALLQEMRDRLETLPVSADVPQAELTTDGASLPRREPAAAAATTATVPAGPAAGAFGRPIEPAEAPTPADEPAEPAANPFTAPTVEAASPVAAPEADPFTAAPAPGPGYDQIADTGHRIADPFGRGHAPAPATEPTPPADPFTPAPADPFAAQPMADPFVVAPQPDPAPAAETPIAPAAAPFLDPTDLAAEQPPTNPFGGPPPIPDPTRVFGTESPAPAPPVDPFAAPAPAGDLFAPATPTEVAAEAQAVEPFPELDQTPPAPAAPPAQPAADPFAAAPPAPAPQPAPADSFATSAPAPAPAEPFTAPASDPAPAPADPFGAVAAPAPAPTPAATATAPPPPPLPTAVDPVTGEPDQAAYTAWLVEWLAYAEKYGEETPEDPSRVF